MMINIIPSLAGASHFVNGSKKTDIDGISLIISLYIYGMNYGLYIYIYSFVYIVLYSYIYI